MDVLLAVSWAVEMAGHLAATKDVSSAVTLVDEWVDKMAAN